MAIGCLEHVGLYKQMATIQWGETRRKKRETPSRASEKLEKLFGGNGWWIQAGEDKGNGGTGNAVAISGLSGNVLRAKVLHGREEIFWRRSLLKGWHGGPGRKREKGWADGGI